MGRPDRLGMRIGRRSGPSAVTGRGLRPSSVGSPAHVACRSRRVRQFRRSGTPPRLCGAATVAARGRSLLLFTAGDEEVQRTRIAQSGLAEFLESVRITPLKTLESWRDLLTIELCDQRWRG